MNTAAAQATFANSRSARIDSSYLTSFSDQNDTVSNSSAVLDGDISTIYGSINASCWIGIDIGTDLAILIQRIRYFPTLNWNNVANMLLEAVFEGSSDKTNWNSLGLADSTIHVGWNTLEVAAQLSYRYLRMRHNSTSQCNIAEVEVYGQVYTNATISLTSQPVTVTYKDGYNSINFANAL
jgi:hypothetical protein